MFVLLAIALALLAPAPPQGGAIISGVVVARDSHRPVQRARVTLAHVGAGPPISTTTDAQGVFTFSGLSSGRYTIFATKSGFLTSFYGEKTPGVSRAGTSFTLTATQRLDRVVLRLPRGGAIAGVISDDLGDPAFGVQVRALQLRTGVDGRGVSIAGTATTDDRGVYRVPLLAPGEYVVCAMPAAERTLASSQAEAITRVEQLVSRPPSAGTPLPPSPIITTPPEGEQLTSYVPVCFPGTTTFTGATPIGLGLSEEHGGVDVQLQLQPALNVSGTVVDPAGGEFSTEVQLVTSGASVIPAVAGLSTWNTMAGPAGQFAFTGIPPGQYTLLARARRPATPRVDPAGGRALGMAPADVRWASEDLTVGFANVPDLLLTLQRGLSVSGTVVFDGPAPARSSRMVVMFTPAGETRGLAELGGLQTAPVDEGGRFTMNDLVPGRYRLAPTPMPGSFTLESAMFGGRDVLDFPLEVKPGVPMPAGLVTLTTKQTGMEGRLFDSAGALAPSRTVVVFSEDQRCWTIGSRRIAVATTSETGAFTFSLPPGNYRVGAADLDGRSAFNPAVLTELLATATPVTLAAGETKLVDVRIR